MSDDREPKLNGHEVDRPNPKIVSRPRLQLVAEDPVRAHVRKVMKKLKKLPNTRHTSSIIGGGDLIGGAA